MDRETECECFETEAIGRAAIDEPEAGDFNRITLDLDRCAGDRVYAEPDVGV